MENKIEDITFNYEYVDENEYGKEVSNEKYVRNSHYHMEEGERDFPNISIEGKISCLVDMIRYFEKFYLIQKEDGDLSKVEYMMMLDDKKVEFSNGDKRFQSQFIYLNMLNGMLEELLEEYNGN